jgi:acylphosphatase
MDSFIKQKSLHAIVEGHVQGVGFRYFVKETADSFSLTGWVRNRYDGSVEFTAEGNLDRLQKLLDAVAIGPSRSIVTNVKADWGESKDLYSQFSFLPTE